MSTSNQHVSGTPGKPSTVDYAVPGKYSSPAYEASAVVKTTAGPLYGISGYNSGPAQFIEVHDSATVPANGATAEISFAVPAASNFSWSARRGYPMDNGIAWCNSTTDPTKTIGAANVRVNVLYGP